MPAHKRAASSPACSATISANADADAALRGIRQQYDQSDIQAAAAFDGHFDDTEERIYAAFSGDSAAQVDVLDWWSSIADWTPADRTDWAAFDSERLTRFATENRAADRERATEELHEAELLDHNGRPGPQFERWLRTLTPLRREHRLRLPAGTRRSAVLATQSDEDTVRLRSVPKDQWCRRSSSCCPSGGGDRRPRSPSPTAGRPTRRTARRSLG